MLEAVIVIGLLSAISATLVGFYGSFSQNLDLEAASRTLISNLKTAQSKAIAGIDGSGDNLADQWGVCLRNPAGANNDYYEIIYSKTTPVSCSNTLTYGVDTTVYLQNGIAFSAPGSGTTQLVMFNRITGTLTSGSNISISLSSSAGQEITSINTAGVALPQDLAVTSITPNSKPNNAAAIGMTVTGIGFDADATVKLSRTGQLDITCTLTSTNTTTIVINSCNDVNGALSGTWDVVVTNVGDATYAVLTDGFTITASTAVTVTDILPVSVVNTANLTLDANNGVTGTGFQSDSVLKLTKSGQSPITCNGYTIISTKLKGGTCSTLGAAVGTWDVDVTSGGATGKCSLANPACSFTVNNVSPTTTSISPVAADLNDESFTLTINGTGFVTGSTVNFGTVRTGITPDSVTSTQITVTILTTDIDDPAITSVSVTVTNPSPCVSSCTSNGQTFTINPLGITVVSISGTGCTAANACSNETVITNATITGTAFTDAAIAVKLTKTGETDITCTGFTYSSETILLNGACDTVGIEAGTWTIDVTVGSNNATAAVLVIDAPAITVTGISPNTVNKSNSAQAFGVIRGTGFQAGTQTVSLKKTGSSDITCTGFAFVSTKILANGTCNIPDTGLLDTEWTVRVVSNGRTADSTCPGAGCVTIKGSTDTNQFYWVKRVGCISGDCYSGNWGDNTHWSNTSGGSVAALTAPTSSSHVYFDVNSFPTSGTNLCTTCVVTLNAVASAASVNFSGILKDVSISGSQTMNIAGSANFTSGSTPAVTLSNTGDMTFSSANDEQITLPNKSAAQNVASNIIFSGAGSKTMVNYLHNGTGTTTVSAGGLDMNSKNLTTGNFNNSGEATLTFGVPSSPITMQSGSWTVNASSTLNIGSANVTMQGGTVTFSGGGKTYNALTFASTSGNPTLNGANIFNKAVSFATTSGTVTLAGGNVFESTFGITGASSVASLGSNNRFKGATTFSGSGNVGMTSGNTFDLAVTTTGSISMTSGNTFSGALTVNGTGASSMTSGNTFAGAVSIAGNTTITTTSGSHNNFNSTFAVTGVKNLTLSSNSTTHSIFTGAVTVGGTATLSSYNVFSAAVDIEGDTTMTNNNAFASSLTVGTAVVEASNYSYRRIVTINNTANPLTLTNHQISVTLDTATLISAGKMQSDCDDIRVKDTNQTTELSYWVGGCNTANTTIWFKVPSITGSSNKTVYIYYGDTSASSEVNGNNVFEFFDDFNTGSTYDSAKWTWFSGDGSTVSVTGGELVINVFGTTGATNLSSIPTFDRGIFEVDSRITAGGSSEGHIVQYFSGTTNNHALRSTSPRHYISTTSGGTLYESPGTNSYLTRITFPGANSNTATGFMRRMSVTTSCPTDTTATGCDKIESGAITISNGSVGMGGHSSGAVLRYDNARVAKLPASGAYPTASAASETFIGGVGNLTMGSSNNFTGAVFAGGGVDISSSNQFTSTLTASSTQATSTISSGNTFGDVVTISSVSSTITGPNTWNTGSSLVLDGFGTATINGTSAGANAYKTLTRTAPATKTVAIKFGADQTIGTLNLNGNSLSNRLFVQSDTYGTARTITATTLSLSNADFEDITGAGGTWTGTSLGGGSFMGDSNITFTAAATKYWAGDTGSWSDPGKWSLSSGGTVCNCISLPQDTAVFDGLSFSGTGKTVTIDAPRLAKDLTFSGMGADNPTVEFKISSNLYGSPTFGTMVTAGAGTLNLVSRSSATLTSNSHSLGIPLVINALGGTISLGDAFSSSSTIALTRGTFSANNQTVTASKVSTASTSTALTLGNNTWTITGTGTGASSPWNINNVTTISSTAGANAKIVMNASSSDKNFIGAGKTYQTLQISGSGATTIDAGNTFNDLTSSIGGALAVTGPTTVGGNFSHTGAGNLTFGSASTSSTVTGTFTKSGSGTNTINGTNTFGGAFSQTDGALTIANTNNFNGTFDFNVSNQSLNINAANHFNDTSVNSFKFTSTSGSLIMNKGSEVNGSDVDGTFTFTGNGSGAGFTINDANTFGDFVIAGTNVANTMTFTAGNSFANFTATTSAAAKTINFQSGVTQTVRAGGTFTATGNTTALSANRIILQRNGGSVGSQWTIDAPAANVAGVSVANSADIGTGTFYCSIATENCVDGTNNTGWTFLP